MSAGKDPSKFECRPEKQAVCILKLILHAGMMRKSTSKQGTFLAKVVTPIQLSQWAAGSS